MGLKELIKSFKEAVGYWFIGGCFAIIEIILLFIFVDNLHFKAWLVGVVWVFGGAIARYMIHKWYFTGRNMEVAESG